MQRKLTVATLLLWMLLPAVPITLTPVQAQDVTLTLSADQATYPAGGHATVTLTLDAATAMRVRIGDETLGCDWNIVMLDATGTEVFDARARWRGRRVRCRDIATLTHLPPPW